MESIAQYFAVDPNKRAELVSSWPESELPSIVKKIVADRLGPQTPPPILEIISQFIQQVLDKLKANEFLQKQRISVPSFQFRIPSAGGDDENERSRSRVCEEIMEAILDKILDPKFVTPQTISFTKNLIVFIIEKHAWLIFVRAGRKNIQFVGPCYLNSGLPLGKGAFGSVFRGYNTLTGEHVAIKSMDRKMVFSNPLNEKNIRQEIETMKELDNKNIVRMYDAPEQKDFIYIVMELCEGGTLADFMKAFQFDQSMIFHVMSEIANGLKYLRSKSIIHRDLKLANILISQKGNNRPTIKLADFTFARLLETGAHAATYCGTKIYMAPEILRRQTYTDKCDLWSLGVVFFEINYGVKPFPAQNEGELLQMVSHDLVYPASPLTTPESLDLLKKMLARDPQKRIGWDDFFAHPYFKSAPASPVSTETDMQKVQNELEKIWKRAIDLETKLNNQKEENQRARNQLIAAYDTKMEQMKRGHEEQIAKLQDENKALKAANETLQLTLKVKEKTTAERGELLVEIERLKTNEVELQRQLKGACEERDEKINLYERVLDDAVETYSLISDLKMKLLNLEASSK